MRARAFLAHTSLERGGGWAAAAGGCGILPCRACRCGLAALGRAPGILDGRDGGENAGAAGAVRLALLMWMPGGEGASCHVLPLLAF
jgi:hypothetical protein